MSCCCRNDQKGNGFAEAIATVLDGLVTVNSLFTSAVFLGLSFASPGNLTSLDNRPECNADSGVVKRLVVYEVLSFSLFLLSSLVAKTVKVHLCIYGKEEKKNGCYYSCIRPVLLFLSVGASIVGLVFLTLSMVHIIQIKIGTLSCGSAYTARAVVSLGSIVGLALIIYAYAMMHAICRSIWSITAHSSQKRNTCKVL